MLCCRLCLKVNINLQNIISSKLKCAELTLIESINCVFGIEIHVNDPYTKFICAHCENVIQYVGSYRTLYRRNQLILEGKSSYRNEDDKDLNQTIGQLVDGGPPETALSQDVKINRDKIRKLELLKYYYEIPTTAIRELIRDKNRETNDGICIKDVKSNDKSLFRVKGIVEVEVCKYCSKIFKTKRLLRYHYNTMHKSIGIECELKNIIRFKHDYKQNPFHKSGMTKHKKNLLFDTTQFPNLNFVTKLGMHENKDTTLRNIMRNQPKTVYSNRQNNKCEGEHRRINDITESICVGEYSKDRKIISGYEENNGGSSKYNWLPQKNSGPEGLNQNNAAMTKHVAEREKQQRAIQQVGISDGEKTKKYVSSVLLRLNQINTVRDKMALKKITTMANGNYENIGNANANAKILKTNGYRIIKNLERALMRKVSENSMLKDDKPGETKNSKDPNQILSNTEKICTTGINAKNQILNPKDSLVPQEKQLHQNVKNKKCLSDNKQKSMKEWKEKISKDLPRLKQIGENILSKSSQNRKWGCMTYTNEEKITADLSSANGTSATSRYTFLNAKSKIKSPEKNCYKFKNAKDCYISLKKCPTPPESYEHHEIKQDSKYVSLQSNNYHFQTYTGSRVKNASPRGKRNTRATKKKAKINRNSDDQLMSKCKKTSNVKDIEIVIPRIDPLLTRMNCNIVKLGTGTEKGLNCPHSYYRDEENAPDLGLPYRRSLARFCKTLKRDLETENNSLRTIPDEPPELDLQEYNFPLTRQSVICSEGKHPETKVTLVKGGYNLRSLTVNSSHSLNTTQINSIQKEQTQKPCLSKSLSRTRWTKNNKQRKEKLNVFPDASLGEISIKDSVSQIGSALNDSEQPKYPIARKSKKKGRGVRSQKCKRILKKQNEVFVSSSTGAENVKNTTITEDCSVGRNSGTEKDKEISLLEYCPPLIKQEMPWADEVIINDASPDFYCELEDMPFLEREDDCSYLGSDPCSEEGTNETKFSFQSDIKNRWSQIVNNGQDIREILDPGPSGADLHNFAHGIVMRNLKREALIGASIIT